MRDTDRGLYVPPHDPSSRRSATYAYGPYADAPQALGFKSTISAPHVHGQALEALSQYLTRPAARALDVGSGSGIMLAYFSRMVPAGGLVVGVEIVKQLVPKSVESLLQDGILIEHPPPPPPPPNPPPPTTTTAAPPIDERVPVSVFACDACSFDFSSPLLPPSLLFDAIHVGAASSSVPAALLRRLAVGGRMVIPLGDRERQVLTAVDKICEGDIAMTPIANSRYVPLQRIDSDDDQSSSKAFGHRKLKYDGERKRNTDVPSTVEGQTAAATTHNPTSTLPPGNPPDYDARYRKGYAYGTTPSTFLVSALSSVLPPSPTPLSVLSIGEGQGRNVCHLATLGHSCLAVDSSSVGLSKARALAFRLGVSALVSTQFCDVSSSSFEPGVESFDVVLDVFCPLPAVSRRAVHDKCYRALRPGGVFIVQCFSPRQRQAAEGDGRPFAAGPSDATAYVDHEELRQYFGAISEDAATVLLAREVDGALEEGKFHRGRAITTEFVVKKAVAGTTTMTTTTTTTTTTTRAAAAAAAATTSTCFRDAVDEVFEEASSLAIDDDIETIAANTLSSFIKSQPELRHTSEPPSDQFLFCAPASLRISCDFASRHGVCRYCWLPRSECLCGEFDRLFNSITSSSSARPTSPPESSRIRWIVFSHPNEFLRATSTAKIAAQLLGEDCEFLVFGASRHHDRLRDIVSSGQPISILFPGYLEDSLTVEEALKEGRASIAGKRVAENFSEEEPKATPEGARTPSSSQAAPPVHFVLVPDGSWFNAKALVAFMQRLLATRSVPLPSKPFVRLDDGPIAAYTSPLIEALNAGSGRGRVSTLEAMAFFLEEASGGELAGAHPRLDLGACGKVLQPLVSYVHRLNSSSLGVSCLSSSQRSPSVPALTRSLEALVAAYVSSSSSSASLAPLGLRRCGVCGATMSTAQRMLAHLSGRRHCEAVANLILEGEGEGEEGALASGDLEDEKLRRLFDKYSTRALEEGARDPPDFAMAVFQSVKDRQQRADTAK